ncbi:hypothetical protein [Chryseobacterium lathyri]|uniref:Uncharacterized protein n=1 Tax=Chryseobacterium lathyri TaxID=395933 RepID=A0A511YFU0_9FLAO|nr:hypothetical protein [Chryseobacterium lathyri]GEN74065.1 hypothetical protein CLA01_41370 [Chryseobacterium lathyri]
MKKLKFFYEPSEQQYYVLFQSPSKDLLFKVDQVNPTMISRVYENAMFISSHERAKIIEEMEIFAKEQFDKLNDSF